MANPVGNIPVRAVWRLCGGIRKKIKITTVKIIQVMTRKWGKSFG
jgi:hypothetical protein